MRQRTLKRRGRGRERRLWELCCLLNIMRYQKVLMLAFALLLVNLKRSNGTDGFETDRGVGAELESVLNIPLSKPTLVHLLSNATKKIVVNISDSTTVGVTAQAQTQFQNVTISLLKVLHLSSSYSGSSAGLVVPLKQGAVQAHFYITSAENVTACVTAVPYSAHDPVPGACNLEFHLENDPNLHLRDTFYETVTQFAPANLGAERDADPPACDVEMGTKSRWRLTYDLYQYFLPENDLSEQSLFEGVVKMTSVQDVEKHGTKIAVLTSGEKTLLFGNSYTDIGGIYSLIVRDPLLNTSAAYIPVSTYSCSQSSESPHYCYRYGQVSTQIFFSLLGIYGLFICFAGHRFLEAEFLFIGFLLFGFLSFVLLKRFSQISAHLNVKVFRSEPLFWVCFVSMALVLPVILLSFTKALNILSCAVLGSYAGICLVGAFLPTSLVYILLDVVRRAVEPSYSRAIIPVPFQTTDYVLVASWALLAAGGVASQCFLTRNKPPFSQCPYESWREKRDACSERSPLLGPEEHVDVLS
ncbi:transmembrane 7 superfamily member 3-like isoform X2 [Acipenser ruthenus]|uniref:transmembrane 7 superfamily member 3-like isoform X2 n=1 Tax=Acipenser ruthenus TaxID=7906 RepID=UPI0027423005|nr:transmembrane 7 superfamily member 3-like isoform X2 [Acipenser ruthenus]